MASTNCKISIIKTNSLRPKYGIDRAMPAVMKRRMGEHEWERFCNQVDNIMEPLNKRKCKDFVMDLGFIFSLPLFVVIIILSPSLYLLFIPSALVLFTCWLIGRAGSEKRAVYEQLRQLCEETSRANDEISFHFRFGAIQGSEATCSGPFFIEAYIRTIDVVVVAGSSSDNTTIQAIDSRASKQFPEVGHSMTILPFAKVITVDEEGTPARELQADDQKDVEKDMELACSGRV
ncbi:hypothetical protein IV203_004635 [Nitzschia inconspicua]|uniref:Uncharacterized protein n=1 Tax=Nitzschia inconspicua TaxID=303405 RepID=A0A9K3L431_9STRA|nr:hypothetical protein IV203_004635 [Nitzschia inconspicua]